MKLRHIVFEIRKNIDNIYNSTPSTTTEVGYAPYTIRWSVITDNRTTSTTSFPYYTTFNIY